jgi:hypothetical protein
MSKRIEHNGSYLYVNYPNAGDINYIWTNSKEAIDDWTENIIEQCVICGYDEEQTKKCVSYMISEYSNYSNWNDCNE